MSSLDADRRAFGRTLRGLLAETADPDRGVSTDDVVHALGVPRDLAAGIARDANRLTDQAGIDDIVEKWESMTFDELEEAEKLSPTELADRLRERMGYF